MKYKNLLAVGMVLFEVLCVSGLRAHSLLKNNLTGLPLKEAKLAAPEGLTDAEWAQILSKIQDNEYRITEKSPTAWTAVNPGQGWNILFDARGFAVEMDRGAREWGLDLKAFGWAGQQQQIEGKASVGFEEGRIVYQWSDILHEWFVNDHAGLEHGFTISERPEAHGKPSELAFALGVRGGLKPAVSANGTHIDFQDETGKTVLQYAALKVWDAEGRQLPSRFVQESDQLVQLNVDETGAKYPLMVDPVASQQAYVKASNTEARDNFGISVAISGDTMLVGANGEDSNATGVNGNQSDNSATDSGAVYVFRRTGSTWAQEAYLKASNSEAGDGFGENTDIDGDTIAIGSMFEDSASTGINGSQTDNSASASGAVYIFVRNGTTWTQQAYIKASNTNANDIFGRSVALSGDTLVVGAFQEDSNATGINGNQSDNSASGSGAAYVFVRSGTTWTQQAYLKASNTGASDMFGVFVSVSGDTAVVGAYGEDSNATGINGNQSDNSASGSGAAYVFVRSGTTWTQQAYVKASDSPAGSFGQCLAISGNTLAIGSTWKMAVYVFERSGTTWSQQAKLQASNGDSADGYALSLDLDANTIVVGAYTESSAATGINGDEADNSAVSAGAAYVFVRNGTSWYQQAYLKASNTAANDHFGFPARLSGDTIILGGYGEDSNATGIGGNQSDNSATIAGAAYVFNGLGSSYDFLGKLIGVNVEVRNQTLTGNAAQFGFVSNGTANGLQFSDGVILSTGTTAWAGTNVSGSTSVQYGGSGDGDADLNAAAYGGTSISQDAAVLEFDVKPAGSTLYLNFAFASEEYLERVTTYSDAMAISIGGATSTIGVSTINSATNSILYRDNSTSPAPLSLIFDGLTVELTLPFTVTPNVWQHMKIVIGDANDDLWDSATFLRAESLRSF